MYIDHETLNQFSRYILVLFVSSSLEKSTCSSDLALLILDWKRFILADFRKSLLIELVILKFLLLLCFSLVLGDFRKGGSL